MDVTVTQPPRQGFGGPEMHVAVSQLGPSPRVILVDSYCDGTIWWVMEDADGKRAVVCLDGCRGSPTQFLLLDGTRHPKHPRGRLLELGGPEEGIVVPLLSNWLDAQHPKGVPAEYGVELIRDALLRLGEPPEQSSPPSG